MKAHQRYTITPYLPEPLEPLRVLAYNLWWAWHPEGIELFRRIDRGLWEDVDHNPVAILAVVPQERLDALALDESFLDHIRRVQSAVTRYHNTDAWFDENYPEYDGSRIAYFSLEYGLSECLPIYSGGLGLLAGDHLKSASDMGVPLVGVGLLYQEGYFRQYLDRDGWQQEEYPDNDFHSLPVMPVVDDAGEQMRVTVPMDGRDVQAGIWKVTVGRVPLYQLDTWLPENAAEDREITARLYGGGNEMRIRQEIVLGMGGIRTLCELGIRTHVYHMNEGHSAFLALERIRGFMKQYGLSFEEARELAAIGHVFTTHTPVPAGHDFFSPGLVDKCLGHLYGELGLSRDEFLALGREDPTDANEPVCMTILALRLSAWRNGVSRLHGEVSRRMWHGLWPHVDAEEAPIASVTNGVHVPSWISHDLAGLFDRYLGIRWRSDRSDESVWGRVAEIPDTEVWRTHERRRERLVAVTRRRLREQLQARGASPAELAPADEVLDPEALTIGFARRFATYKRATLLLRDPERLKRLLSDPDQPVQIIFAGKAHPNDGPAKELIRQLIHFPRQPEVRRRIVFLENYDMALARYLVQGCDIWLNTPRRPEEASGTSGIKATANGALNVSVLDGWWCEGYAPGTGWAIGRGEEYDDHNYQDDLESHILFDILEKEVVPLFYDRGHDDMPRRWIAMMKQAMMAIGPAFNANRMVAGYVENFYLAGIERSKALEADNGLRARALAAWKRTLTQAWPEVRIAQIEDDQEGEVEVGSTFSVRVSVSLGGIPPEHVRVELCYGPLDLEGGIRDATIVRMQSTGVAPDQTHQFVGRVVATTAGRQGYTVRVMPSHEDLVHPVDTGLVVWA